MTYSQRRKCLFAFDVEVNLFFSFVSPIELEVKYLTSAKFYMIDCIMALRCDLVWGSS